MQPLAGIRVVEAASYISGPFVGLALADLGADVVKIEPPRGDPMRRFGVRYEGKGIGLCFVNINRNKSGMSMDLKSEKGQAAFHEQLDDADVLVTNWRPAVAQRLGLAELQCEHPHLIWLRISGFGANGPDAERTAFDAIAQARSGIVVHNGATPTLVPGYLADKVTGLLASQAVLSALVHRASSKEGAVIDVSMLDAMAYFSGPDLFAGHMLVDRDDPLVARHLSAVRPLRTSDGWMVVSPVSGTQLQSALAAVGHPEWADRLLRVGTPTEMIELFYSLLEGVLSSRRTGEWEQCFRIADVPASAVLDFDGHLRDPQMRHNQMYRETVDEEMGLVRRLRFPALFGGKAVERVEMPAPSLEGPPM